MKDIFPLMLNILFTNLNIQISPYNKKTINNIFIISEFYYISIISPTRNKLIPPVNNIIGEFNNR